MNPSRPLRLGTVGWAELEDVNGYRKVRPVVVVTPTADIDAGRSLRVVAITTRLPDPLPEDHVLLPWDRQGKARSGLRRRCAAVASWQAEIVIGDMQQLVGILSPSVIGELLNNLSECLPPLSTTPPGETDAPAFGPSGDPPTVHPPIADDRGDAAEGT